MKKLLEKTRLVGWAVFVTVAICAAYGLQEWCGWRRIESQLLLLGICLVAVAIDFLRKK